MLHFSSSLSFRKFLPSVDWTSHKTTKESWKSCTSFCDSYTGINHANPEHHAVYSTVCCLEQENSTESLTIFGSWEKICQLMLNSELTFLSQISMLYLLSHRSVPLGITHGTCAFLTLPPAHLSLLITLSGSCWQSHTETLVCKHLDDFKCSCDC